MLDSREASLLILEDILYERAYSNISLNKNIKKYGLHDQEAFIRELVYGVIEDKLYLDSIIKKVSKIKLKKIHKKIYIILLLGIYQIYFMDKVPVSAAVNESVKLAKKYGNRGSVGFVNGSLRNISRNREKLGEIHGKSKNEYLSIKYSHPMWLVEYFIDEFGFEFAENLLRANNELAVFSIRVNILKTSKENLKEKLINLGYSIEESKIAEDSLIVKNPSNIFNTREFREGLFTVQGESSSLVGDVISPEENSKVLDTCAAPGGKSIHLAEKMNNKGLVIARDIYLHRLGLIEENTRRLGIDIVKIEEFDASEFDENLRGCMDYCLVDAPCSGLGTIRRSPEIKYNRSYEDVLELSRLQKLILETSKDYVRTGGYLIYSTCTVGKLENDKIVEEFLENNEEYSLEGEYIKLYPNVNNTDGFFIAKMKKNK